MYPRTGIVLQSWSQFDPRLRALPPFAAIQLFFDVDVHALFGMLDGVYVPVSCR
jgi:hypothetical protein